MSGLQALVEYPHYSATPSNCGETHPTLEHQAARRQGARGQGNDLGYGKSIEGRSSLSIERRVEVGDPQPSPSLCGANSQG